MRCTQTTHQGTQCRNNCVPGFDRCVSHLGRVGRHTLLTPELADNLLAALRAGAYLHVAARAVGIRRETLADWMRRGREGDAPFAELLTQIEEAQAAGEVRNVATVANAARENWQAAAWLLERGYPERWGRVSTRLRLPDKPPEEQATPPPASALTDRDDPFIEVDELARKRQKRAP